MIPLTTDEMKHSVFEVLLVGNTGIFNLCNIQSLFLNDFKSWSLNVPNPSKDQEQLGVFPSWCLS